MNLGRCTALLFSSSGFRAHEINLKREKKKAKEEITNKEIFMNYIFQDNKILFHFISKMKTTGIEANISHLR